MSMESSSELGLSKPRAIRKQIPSLLQKCIKKLMAICKLKVQSSQRHAGFKVATGATKVLTDLQFCSTSPS